MSRSKWLVFCAAILLPKLVSAQSMRLQDAPLGSVVQIGSFNYIKVAENKYMQSTAVTCPDGVTVGGKYVKCFTSQTAYDDQCNGESGCCTYTESGAITTQGGTYSLYDYSCITPCQSPNAHYNDEQAKCICDNNAYSFISVNGKYGCASLDEYISGINFDYTGDAQVFTVPVDATYKLEVWGASGGDSQNGGDTKVDGGLGGYSYGSIELSANSILYVYVGGQGGSVYQSIEGGIGGYNGGGVGGNGYEDGLKSAGGGGGGGATHIATKNGLLNTLSATSDQKQVLIVAGAGGGAGGSGYGTYSKKYWLAANAGYGGGASGGAGSAISDTNSSGRISSCGSGGGATASKGGTAGKAGTINSTISTSNCYVGGSGGGGGGKYGGGSGGTAAIAYSGADGTAGIAGSFGMGGDGKDGHYSKGTNTEGSCAGGGGSGYIGGVTNGKTFAGNAEFADPDGTIVTGHSGNGHARITLMSVSE